MPSISGVIKVGYEGHREFAHRKMEVLLVLLLSGIKPLTPEPLINDLHEVMLELDYRQEGFRAVCFWIESSMPEALRCNLEEKWYGYEHYVLPVGDRTSPTVRLLDGANTPMAYLIDREGNIAEIFTTKEELATERFRGKLNALLTGKLYKEPATDKPLEMASPAS